MNTESFELWNFQVKILFKTYSLYQMVTEVVNYKTLTTEGDKKTEKTMQRLNNL